jgi:hypothetical protein
MKLKCLLNKKRFHFWYRLKQRHGSLFYFLLAKVVGKKQCFDKNCECLIWEYKNHRFLTQNNQLQTYINTLF